MSQKEIKRIKVMELLVNGRMTNQEAAESLGLCRRQIIRLRKKYTTQGWTLVKKTDRKSEGIMI